MKRTGYIKCLGVVALSVVIIALAIWLHGMYRSSMINYVHTADKCLALAADTEYMMRRNSLGPNFVEQFIPYDNDTSAYVTKRMETADTVVYVRIRKDDPDAVVKCFQFGFKYFCPVNTVWLDSLFRQNMAMHSLPVMASYADYLDLKKNTVIASNAPEGMLTGYAATRIDTLDILKTIGVRAYAKTPVTAILQPVMYPLITAVVLILIGLMCMLKLIRDILHLHKEGFRLMRKVSYQADTSVTEAAREVKAAAEQLHEKKLDEEETLLKKTYRQLRNTNTQPSLLWKYLDNEAGKIEFNKAPFYIKPVLEELKEQFEEREDKTISVSVRCDDKLMLNTDEMYFSLVIEELMNNSARFSDEVANISITVKRDEHLVVVSVHDNGWGIGKDDINSIFEFSYQIEKHLLRLKDSDESGIGVGLAFADSVIGSLGGAINVTGLEDEFTIIRIAFPITPEDQNLITRYKNLIKKLFLFC